MSLNKFTLTVRRESFLRGIRHHQREAYKAAHRASLLQHHQQCEHLWLFKMNIFTMDLRFEEQRLLNFLAFLRNHAQDMEFCELVGKWEVMDELMHMVTRAQARGGVEAPRVVEQLFQLTYHLLAQSHTFLGVMQRHFSQLVFLLYRYPQYTANIDKLSRFFTCLADTINNPAWRQDYSKGRIVSEQQVAGRLMATYICQDSYWAFDGDRQVQVRKRSQQWFKNAIKCLEVVYGLLQISPERNSVWESHLVKESLYEGLSVFLNEKQFFIENYQSDSTDSDSMGETIQARECVLESEQSNLYFISVVMDILLLKQKVLEGRQGGILQGILSVLLKEIDRYSIINLTAIKIIKILYEQVILGEQELRVLAQNYHSLAPLIEDIIDNDIY